MTTRLPSIQGVRAIAVISVVAYHCDLLPSGYLGVDAFFTVSGFVVTRSLIGLMEAGVRRPLREFYLRRARRILPPLFIAVSIVLVLSLTFETPGIDQAATARRAVATLTSTANLIYYVDRDSYFAKDGTVDYLRHTWSLSVEEQFYLLLPILISATWYTTRRGRRSRRCLLAALSVAGATSFAYVVARTASEGGADHVRSELFYLLPSRSWQFVSGAIVASTTGRLVWRHASSTGLGLLVASLLVSPASLWGELAMRVAITAGVSLLMYAASSGRRSPALSNRFMTAIGDRSYGWYLLHWPVLVVAEREFGATPLVLGVCALGSLIGAMALFSLVEKPIADRRWNLRMTVRMLATSTTTMSAVLGIFLFTSRLIGSASDIANKYAVNTDPRPGCELFSTEDAPPRPCSRGRGIRRVLLVGDSLAGSLVRMVDEHFAGTSTVDVSVNGACPFVMAPIDAYELATGTLNTAPSSCRALNTERFAYIEATRPDAIIVVNRGHRYISLPSGSPTPEQARTYLRGVAAAISRSIDLGADVVLVGSFPEMPEGTFAAQKESLFNLLTSRSESANTFAFAYQPGQEDEYLFARDLTRLLDPHLQFVEPIRILCADERRCRLRSRNTVFYADESHLSVAGADLLAASIVDAVDRLTD